MSDRTYSLLMNHPTFRLQEVFKLAEQIPNGGNLFLPKNEKLEQNTKCAVLFEDDNYEFTEEILKFAETHGLNRNFGIHLVQDVVANAKLQKPEVSIDELIAALEHYLEYDAFYDFGNLYD